MNVFTLAFLALSAPAFGQTVVFHEDFESGLSNWTTTSLWHLEDSSQTCGAIVAPMPSGTKAAYFGGSVGCTFDTNDGWSWHDGVLTLASPILLPADAGSIALTFATKSEGEDDGVWDTRKVRILVGSTFPTLPTVFSSDWKTQRYDLSAWRGQSIRLAFDFWSGDSVANDFLGWFIDDIDITANPEPATAFCLGDGTWTACPCGNNGTAGNGCATSFNAAGAHLGASGIASVGADSLSLDASGMSVAAATFFQGSAMQTFHPAMLNGDGLRCATGSLIRLRTVFAPGGSVSYPTVAGDTAISVKGAIPPAGATRYYQVRYRNAADFCTSTTYNLTNGVIVTWAP